MKQTNLILLFLVSILMMGCTEINQMSEIIKTDFIDSRNKEVIGTMWINSKDCDKSHPGIWAPQKLQDVPEYYKVLTDTTMNTFNFSFWAGFKPGDKVDVISDTLFNGEIIEMYYINPRRTRVACNGYYYMWKEYLVSVKDSVSTCWDDYIPPYQWEREKE